MTSRDLKDFRQRMCLTQQVGSIPYSTKCEFLNLTKDELLHLIKHFDKINGIERITSLDAVGCECGKVTMEVKNDSNSKELPQDSI